MGFSEVPPDPGRVIEGLRDTGYSFATAIADIVDNSIEAGSGYIQIEIALDLMKDVVVTIADNGCGMTATELRQAMRYGSPRNATRKLSKFGLGLKTASTAFCRRLVVTSRGKGLKASSAAWDLDVIVEKGKWLLEEFKPSAADLELLDEVAPKSAGTVVRWEKVDRLLSGKVAAGKSKALQTAIDKQAEALRQHLAVVFQRYLQDWEKRPGIAITVNGIEVEPWDPFCTGESNTKLLYNHRQRVDLPDSATAAFRVRSYVIPPKGGYDSSDGQAAAKISNENQGIYIYREDRLIHGPDWLRINRQEPHYSLARVEFSFGQELDEAFNVDIKKSRIELYDVIHDFIKEKVMPPVRSLADEIYRGQRKTAVAAASKGLHDGSNQVLSSKGSEIQGVKVDSVDVESETATLRNPKGKITIKIVPEEDPGKGNLWVRTRSSIDDGLLWSPTIIGDHVTVDLNTAHPFYERIYLPERNQAVVQSFDYLLWAIAQAELFVINETHRKALRELRFAASSTLRDLALELPEVQLDGE